MADWKPGDVVAVRSVVVKPVVRNRVNVQVPGMTHTMHFLPGSGYLAPWPDAERLAALQAERDALPGIIEEWHIERHGLRKVIDHLRAQLALRDAVVEAARKVGPSNAFVVEFDRLRHALAALDASENPRGATPTPVCHADSDGDCGWEGCPQLRDHEPAATGRDCPLYQKDDEA